MIPLNPPLRFFTVFLKRNIWVKESSECDLTIIQLYNNNISDLFFQDKKE
jgi:hypothetical protein